MTNSGVVNFNANFVCFRRGDLNVFDRKVFASFPGDGGLDHIRFWLYLLRERFSAHLASDGLLMHMMSADDHRILRRLRSILAFPAVSAGMASQLYNEMFKDIQQINMR